MNITFNNLSHEQLKEYESLRNKYQNLSEEEVNTINQEIEEQQNSGFNLLKTQKKVTKELLDAEFGYLFQ